jgi:hypothetical protein
MCINYMFYIRICIFALKVCHLARSTVRRATKDFSKYSLKYGIICHEAFKDNYLFLM